MGGRRRSNHMTTEFCPLRAPPTTCGRATPGEDRRGRQARRTRGRVQTADDADRQADQQAVSSTDAEITGDERLHAERVDQQTRPDGSQQQPDARAEHADRHALGEHDAATWGALHPTAGITANSPRRSTTDSSIVLATLIAPMISASTTITSAALLMSMPLAPARAASSGVPIAVRPG